MKIEQVRPEDLRPHPKNPRVHPDSAIEKLAVSIREFGWTNPVLVSADGYVLAGHARLKAAQRIGLEKVPVMRLPFEGAKAEAYLLADNRLQEDTNWDMRQLQELVEGLMQTDAEAVLATGFSQQETDDILKLFSSEAFVRPDPVAMAVEFEAQMENVMPVADNAPSTPPSVDGGVATGSATGAQASKNASGGGEWLYVRYYGQAPVFLSLKASLEAKGVMLTGHEIDPGFFYSMVMQEAGKL